MKQHRPRSRRPSHMTPLDGCEHLGTQPIRQYLDQVFARAGLLPVISHEDDAPTCTSSQIPSMPTEEVVVEMARLRDYATRSAECKVDVTNAMAVHQDQMDDIVASAVAEGLSASAAKHSEDYRALRDCVTSLQAAARRLAWLEKDYTTTREVFSRELTRRLNAQPFDARVDRWTA